MCLSATSTKQVHIYLPIDETAVSIEFMKTPSKNQSSNSSVKSDYFHAHGVGDYKVHKEEKTWHDARKICRKENAHLAIINSQEEETVSMP